MRSLSKETAQKILTNELSPEALKRLFPEYQKEVLDELRKLRNQNASDFADSVIAKYAALAKMASQQIHKSGMNEKTVQAFLPHIIKARLAISYIEQLSIAATSEQLSGTLRFNLWDGTLLQKLLFKKGFERKPVSLRLFHICWALIGNKKILMPLVNKKGIYCFYSKPLVKELANLIGDGTCLEIAAGDGTLTRFLRDAGVSCQGTDDYSWAHYITYPDFIERIDAKNALNKYRPQVVVCSWPVPRNPYEKHVFQTDSVEIYIVIGTRNPAVTGDFKAYANAKNFTMELNERLSSLLLPPSGDNAVYIFRRQ